MGQTDPINHSTQISGNCRLVEVLQDRPHRVKNWYLNFGQCSICCTAAVNLSSWYIDPIESIQINISQYGNWTKKSIYHIYLQGAYRPMEFTDFHFKRKKWRLLKKHVTNYIPCSNGHRTGSSPKYWARESAFLPCHHWVQ